MPAKHVLVLTFSPFHLDPRVRRQVESLPTDYDITVAGFGRSPEPGVQFVPIDGMPRRTLPQKLMTAARLALRRFEHCYWHQSAVRRALAQLSGKRFDLVLANDIDTLPVALHLAQGAPVILDAHEYAPREFENDLIWRLLVYPYRDYLCRRYLNACAAMFTVCEGIGQEYNRVYGVTPMIVLNAPHRQELPPSPTSPDRVRLIHHGVALPSRQIDCMIDLFDHLDERFILDLMLVPGQSGYLEKLRHKASRHPRIRFREPVPMPEICKETNAYDLGLFLLPPANFNYKHALPNKFFEFVQARLGIAIGPSLEMARLVEKHGLGVVAASFKPRALAVRLNALTAADITRFKQASDRAAGELCFEQSAQVLRDEVSRVIGEQHNVRH